MKKAIAMTELVIILLAAVAGIGLLFFAKSGVSKVSCLEEVSLCKNSFLFYQKWRLMKWAGIAPNLDCMAVSLPNCEQRDLKTSDKQETMHIIAENLRYCWDKTLGKQNTMGEDFAVNIFGVVGKDIDFCMVCSEFTPNVDISASEWNQYLDSRNPSGNPATYSQIIQPSEPQLLWDGGTKTYKYRDIDFKKGTRYYVVSVSAESSKGDGMVYIYIDPEVDCGKLAPQTHYPQIHYQLK